MPTEGGTYTASIILATYDEDTTAEAHVVQPDGATAAIDATTITGGVAGRDWAVEIPLPLPGILRYRWAIFGTGATLGDPVDIPVAPSGDIDDGRTTYATTTQLARFLRAGPPADAVRMLKDASERIDELLTFAVYDVDEHDMPVDDVVAAAMRDATCAVVKRWIAFGDDGSGAATQVASASIGGVSIGWKGGVDLVGDEARRYLANAKLLGRDPWMY